MFGDGPDGGREATFEGKVPFPSPAQEWDGYGVIQAKFRQRPTRDRADSRWALAALQEELDKFASRKGGRPKPHYYVFATNVALTAGQTKGSRDQVDRVIRRFQKSLGLRDYLIWDYDQICRYLDAYQDIRQRYSLFITSSDVFAEMIRTIEGRRPDFEEVMVNYLQKELRADQFVNLEQAGHLGDEQIPLSRVFIDLPASDERIDEPPDEAEDDPLLGGCVDALLTAGARKLDPVSEPMTARRDIGPANPEQLRRGRFVLIGGPGQGKTTVGQHLCQLHRVALLRRRTDGAYAHNVRFVLDQDWTPLPHAPRFPVRVALSALADAIAKKRVSLLSYVAEHIASRADAEVAPDDLRQWLGAYPWLIVLDGLDEVPVSSNRKDVLDAIQDFWIDAGQASADLLVVATTRPQGYGEEFSRSFYQHLWLAPLSARRALGYAERLADTKWGHKPEDKARVTKALEDAASQETTSRLMRSPLQVTIMTILVHLLGPPPDNRWQLFRKYYDVTYQREMTRPIPAADTLRRHKAVIDAIHQRVGLRIQLESERVGQADARLSVAELGDLVRHHLEEEGFSSEELEHVQNQVLTASAERLVHLVGLELDRVGFEIRSLQEFMAAECLMDVREELLSARLRAIAPHAHWRNVFLFAAGKCFADRPHLRDTIHTICAELNDAEDDEIARTVLAGSQLAVDILEDRSTLQHPKHARRLAEVAARLLSLPPCAHQNRLASVYDPCMKSAYTEAADDRLGRVDLSDRFGAWQLLIPLATKGVEWATKIADERWPREGNERAEILCAGSFVQLGSWLVRRMIDSLPYTSPWELRRVQWNALASLGDGQELPAWCLLALQLFAGPPWETGIEWVRIPLILAQSGAVPMELAIVPVAKGESLAAFRDMPDHEPEWASLVTSADFAEKPSARTLCSALHALADRAGACSGRWPYQCLPWPMAECLALSRTADDLRHWASLAGDGKLGDIREWAKAEERWGEHGVRAEDIEHAAVSGQTLTAHIARQGFPLLSSGLRITRGEEATWLDELSDVYASLPASSARREIASWLAFGLRSSFAGPQPQTMTAERLELVVQDIAEAGRVAPIGLLRHMAYKGKHQRRFLRLAEQVGRLPRLSESSRGIGDARVEALAAAARDDPEALGIVRLFAQGVPEWGPHRVTFSARHGTGADDQYLRGAASALRLLDDDLSPDEAGRLAENVMYHCADALPASWAFRALQVVEQRGVGDPAIDRFLLELAARAASRDPIVASRAIDLLSKSLAQRRSALATRDTWEALGLPAVGIAWS